MGVEETELEMVRRHIREGEGHLANQMALIARLKASEMPTGDAVALLLSFRDIQGLHEAHLMRLEGK